MHNFILPKWKCTSTYYQPYVPLKKKPTTNHSMLLVEGVVILTALFLFVYFNLLQSLIFDCVISVKIVICSNIDSSNL